MNTIHTLFRRDFFRFALASASVWIMVIFVYFIFRQLSLQPHYFSIIGSMIMGGMAGVTIVAVLDTPLFGTSEFWMTRPISGVHLFVSKLSIIILLCVLLPTLVLTVAKALGIAIYMAPLSPAAIFFVFLTYMLGLVIPASLSSSYQQYLILLLFYALGIILLGYFLVVVPAARMETKHVLQHPDTLKWTLLGLWNGGAFFILLYQYARRNRKVTAAALVILHLLLIAVFRLWPTLPRG